MINTIDIDPIRLYTPRRIDSPGRSAAVLIPVIYRDSAPHILFIKRSDELERHPGQMGFPGGGYEPYDAGLEETAYREANEEIALPPNEASTVGRLDDIRTVTDYVVSPFVAEAPDLEYTPNDREVADVAVLPLDKLLDNTNHELERKYHPDYGNSTVHYFYVNGYTIWGATGRILSQFLSLVTDWSPST
ncbi:CoA pyrophosphatase [Salinarchaeum sp. IM2453]|uniref:NUDIX hydrolase n=1 Tax=Salinarchaeum sp. IM2453 TaxID=2862870 RepID=UPI001C83E001|nr:CoA pyrophosphatase [Salinarchaeum sp. IM2453]QZA88727.1 CoA pyrophosphatase [Salinarchaeum sp. IM2453]